MNNETIILIVGIILVILYVFIPENIVMKKIKNIKEKVEKYHIYYIFKLRIIYLVGRLMIAMAANFGAYTAYNDMLGTTYPQDQIESAKIVMFIFLQMGWMITLYIYYDIFTTIYGLCNDLKEVGKKFGKNKL